MFSIVFASNSILNVVDINMMRFIIATLLVAKAAISFGQLNFVNPYRTSTKMEIIARTKIDEQHAALNADFFYKGTKSRMEYTSNDTTFKHRQLKRITLFGKDGDVQYDSLIVAPNDYLVKQFLRKDSMLIVRSLMSSGLQGVDTFIYSRSKELEEQRAESLVKTFAYNDRGWLVLKREITPLATTEEHISYFPDSITVVETKKGKYNKDIRKYFFYFNNRSQLVKDSTYILEQFYSLSNPDSLYHSNTSSFAVAYKYDSEGNHICTEQEGTRYEILYKDEKVVEEKTFSNGELLSRIAYEYLGDGIVKKNCYNADDTEPYEVRFITSKNGVVVGYISINTLSEPGQKEVMRLDNNGRMLSSCSVVLGEDADCKQVEYVDY